MIELNNTLLLGHRGARGEALENTLSGFEYAQKLQLSGLAGVEFDVQLSQDGQLMIFHDDTLERMCAQQSRLDQLNMSEIQRQRQFGQHIITLPDIASAINTYTYIELEVKTHSRTDYAKLVKALMRDLIDSPLASLPIVLTSFDVELHARLQRSTSLRHIPRGLLIREPELLKQAPNTALQLGCRQLGIHYPLLNHKVIQSCHRYDLPVSAWTVNDIETIKQLIDWQVDVIITDYPSYLLLP
ncbi:glycerophosphodiester phosphodiesterase [Psychrobacter glacincola]|uniref:glycerophosphodiester phosphodiesterase n=1 Tax=Psychrobacter glacincola TaxID=56810 RepID=UPI003BB6ED18|tara:strand:- start:33 stop:761 length:729 start_codon:yes stop_codon:yes gene_type:complete